MTLTVLADASVRASSLSPAALISSYTGTAANPATIDIPLSYLKHMEATLAEEGGGTFWLAHYQPGQVETATQFHEVSAVAEVGGKCRLTIDGTSGGHSLDTTKQSTLTLPPTDYGDVTDYQTSFSHVDDGTTWG